jgi:hypothetical protein
VRFAAARRALGAVPLVLLFTARAWGVPAENAGTVEDNRPGRVLYVLNPTVVRTRGGGNLSVDLPRGQAVVLVDRGPDRAILVPSDGDAGLLRAYGVRRVPRYTATPEQIARDFVPAAAWEKARAEGARLVRERWPALTPEQAGQIFLGWPFVGMTGDQAEEAIGRVVLAREAVPGDAGAVVWKVGRRPRSSELRLFTESRERGTRARTFEEFLATKIRALLTFRGGILAAIDPPENQTAGLNWP